jgi:hypothetical protein
MSGTETKAALLAKFGADQATADQMATAAESAVAEEPTDIGLSPVVDAPQQEAQQIPQAFMAAARAAKASKAIAGAAAANARLNRVVPEAQKISIYKRLDAGQHMFIGTYTVTEISTGGGTVEAFIRRHLNAWLDPGVNWFRTDSVDAAGVVRQHGEISVAGASPPVTPEKPSTPLTALPTVALPPVLDPIAEFTRLEDLNARRHAAWKEQQAEMQQREREMQATIEKLSQNGGGNNMAPLFALMMSQQRQPAAPPADLRAEAALMDERIDRKLQPLALSMNTIADRLAALANQPAPPPMAPPPPAPDPLIAITRLMEVMKPTTPPGPTAAEIQAMIMTAVQSSQPKDTFSLKDWMMMKSTEDDRRERMIKDEREAAEKKLDRLEAAMDRRMSELKAAPPRDSVAGLLEGVKAARELSQVLAPTGEPSSTIDKAFEAAVNPDFWAGLSDFVVNIQAAKAGAGQQEGDPENEAIEATEAPPAAPQQRPRPQPAPQAQPATAAPQTKPERPRAVRPADMGAQDYPEGFDALVEQIAGVCAAAPTTPQEVQKQVMSVVVALDFCRQKSPEWRRRVQGALTRVVMGGPEHVKTWFFPFLRGLAKSGKLPLTSVEILQNTVETNAEAIVAFIKSKMEGAKKPTTPPAELPAPAA